jgi:hydroxymethylbilane synthase
VALIRIGTRGSPLALAQAHLVRAGLMAAHTLTVAQFEIVVIKTSGDQIQDQPLAAFGGKGLFTKEIEAALLANQIDMAVHSMKDVATRLPDGLTMTAILVREDPRDAFLSSIAPSLAALPPGAKVGTASLRRQAQVLHARPDLIVVPFRGTVQTRLKKLADGVADATFLAMAGLNRLAMTHAMVRAVATAEMLPAVAQGAIGVECRSDDEKTAAMLAVLDHQPTHLAVTCERAFLAKLDGSCRTPIAGLAILDAAHRLTFKGEILTPDGATRYATHRDGPAKDAIRMGEDAAAELLGRAGPGFFQGGS